MKIFHLCSIGVELLYALCGIVHRDMHDLSILPDLPGDLDSGLAREKSSPRRVHSGEKSLYLCHIFRFTLQSLSFWVREGGRAEGQLQGNLEFR